jgi:hypothetical protein
MWNAGEQPSKSVVQQALSAVVHIQHLWHEHGKKLMLSKFLAVGVGKSWWDRAYGREDSLPAKTLDAYLTHSD